MNNENNYRNEQHTLPVEVLSKRAAVHNAAHQRMMLKVNSMRDEVDQDMKN